MNTYLKKVLKTFIQAFLSSIIVSANFYKEFDKNVIMAILISATAAGLSAVMNIQDLK